MSKTIIYYFVTSIVHQMNICLLSIESASDMASESLVEYDLKKYSPFTGETDNREYITLSIIGS